MFLGINLDAKSGLKDRMKKNKSGAKHKTLENVGVEEHCDEHEDKNWGSETRDKDSFICKHRSPLTSVTMSDNDKFYSKKQSKVIMKENSVLV